MALIGAIAERTSQLWVPGDPIDLVSVSLDGNANPADIEGMVASNSAGRQWLNDEMPTDTYLDYLEFYGILNPYELLDEFSEHVELVTSY